MKTCSKCHETKELTEFNRNRARRDGHESRCKICHRQDSKNWQRGPGKAAHGEAVKAWLQRNPERRLAADRRTREKNPLHWRARRAVADAIRRGRLTRPENCEQCGNAGSIQAHHWRGYERPAWLDVQWLCVPCHRTAHISQEAAA